jgi:hypothetical protein
MTSQPKILGLAVILLVAVSLYFFSNPVKVVSPEHIPTPTPTTQSPDEELVVVLEKPQEGSSISSPLTVHGKARSNWFFEGSFPVQLLDSTGTVIAEGPATALGEWMTAEFSAFTARLVFPKQDAGEKGTLVLRKDNPSGLPEHDESRHITIYFK